jgi:poly(A) polymerase
MKIEKPEIKKIFATFNSVKMDSIRLVGGCVRDLISGKKLNDFDFACAFLPEKIIEILQKNHIKAIPTGIKHGTVTAHINGQNFEITTLRSDIEGDGRHAKVEFVDDYFLDAKRRDFTINALYLDENGEIYDYFNGIEDLKNENVKFIGDANERIQEDYLRILRFFRFSIRFAKSLDEEGFQACLNNKNGIKNLSNDRIRIEFLKFFNNGDIEQEKLLKALKFFEDNFRSEIFSQNLSLKNLENLLNFNQKTHDNLKFACLLISSETLMKNLDEALNRLNFSNFDKNYFHFLLSNLDEKNYKKLLAFYQNDFVRDLYLLQCANFGSFDKNQLEFIENFILPNFPLSGDDFLKLGFKGQEIGKNIQKAKEAWILSDFKLEKNDLIKIFTT